uniref:SMODS and SLOG-associating 2TM effector domain-containing protein n=1 Tax=Candidatus Kentrum sp. FW TaxID=2126338 RepID=A0A450SKX0_9GAMM|nr:MAG: hypothetical protein BECKFW1821A_GA0114235_100742 [Candidatus Kentron sp. FW]VFJ54227.1 MAG: hypothetical protein BECKFW1821B_GA0114236_101733 [Candidatus Kentron sp. FW]
MVIDQNLQNELREYAWKYFSFHAEQRLKTFHFFVILSAVLTGAIFTLITETGDTGYVAPLAYLLTIFSFVFWKLDIRNKELIKHGENVLKNLEALLMFVYEEWKINEKSKFPKMSLFSTHMSYSDCFNMVFCVFGVGGFILGTIFVLKVVT